MPDYLLSAVGIAILIVTAWGLRYLLRSLQQEFVWITAIALTPVVLGLLFGYARLMAPALPLSILRTLFMVAGFAVLIPLLLNQRSLLWARPNLDWFLPIFMAIPVFLIVTPPFNSFDPANYMLIGKTFLTPEAIRDFPFVLPDRGTPIFSWFSHPPLLPLIYSWLLLFRLTWMVPYVGAAYFLLTLMLVFVIIRKHTDLTTATAWALMLGITPVAVSTAAQGFTAPLRMFFFTAAPLVLIDRKGECHPVHAGLLSGAAMASHTIGLLSVLAILAAILVQNGRRFWKPALIFGGTAILVGGFWYAWTFHHLGSLYSSSRFFQIFPDLTREAIAFQFAQRGMVTSSDVFIKGVLGPVTRLSSYGLTFLFGLAALLLTIPFRKLRPSAPVAIVLVTYLAFHLVPGHFRIAVLSPRYPLTVLPLVLIAGSAAFSWKYTRWVPVALASVSFMITLSCWNPYHPEPDHYQAMARAVRKFVAPTDVVLVVHCPYFFLENNRNGRDSMDPALRDLYEAPNMNVLLGRLKKHGFTHILMPWSPSPFESGGFVRKLFVTPGLVQPLAHTRAFHLYRLQYPDKPLPEPPTRATTLAANLHDLPMTAYPNARGHLQVRFWDTGRAVAVAALQRETVFALARAPLWDPFAGAIPVSGSRALSVRVQFGPIPKGTVVHPVVAQYNRDGHRITLSQANPITVRGTDTTLSWPTDYPGFQANQLQLRPTCDRIAVGFSFYRAPGGMSIESITVTGFQ